MEFSPFNPIVKLCLEGMQQEEQGKHDEANKLFLSAWQQAETGLEKFLSAYFLARHQANSTEKLHWFETALTAGAKNKRRFR